MARKIRLRLKLASGAPRWIEGELFELRRMLESCVRRASSRVKAGEVCLTLNVAPGVSGRLELTVSTKLEVEMAESVLVMSGCAVEDPFTASKRDGGELQLLVFHAEEQTGRNIARSLVELGHGVRLARQISAFKRLIDIGKFDVFIFDSSHPNLREFSKIARNFRLPLVSLGRPASPENGALGGGGGLSRGDAHKGDLGSSAVQCRW